jgi:hypothetical protein
MQKNRLTAAGKVTLVQHHAYPCSQLPHMPPRAVRLLAWILCLMERLRDIDHQVAYPPVSTAIMLQVGLLTGALSEAARPWDTAEVPLQPPARTELEAASRQVGWHC